VALNTIKQTNNQEKIKMGFDFNYGVDPTDLAYLHGASACHGAVTKCLFVVIQSNAILNEHIDIL
jgi:hypothetical protein